MKVTLVCVFIFFAIVSCSDIGFVCSEENDIFQLLLQSGQSHLVTRYDTVDTALQDLAPGSGLIILNDFYPLQPFLIGNSHYARAAALNLNVFIEVPSQIPTCSVSDLYEMNPFWRIIVTNPSFMNMQENDILFAHNAYAVVIQCNNTLSLNITTVGNQTDISCGYLQSRIPLVLGNVAGYLRDPFGPPPCDITQQWWTASVPAMLAINNPPIYPNMLVASTKFSQVVTARYAPIPAWQQVWNQIFQFVAPGTSLRLPAWKQIVSPSYGPNEPLPQEYELLSFKRSSDWLRYNSGLFVSSETFENPNISCPAPFAPNLDDIICVKQCIFSDIYWNGSQSIESSIRMDNNGPAAMVLALKGVIEKNSKYIKEAAAILDYIYFYSEAQQGPRANVSSGAYGILAWGVSSLPWFIGLYGDSDGSCLIGSFVVASIVNDNRWDEPFLKALLADLRTSGQNGYRPGRINLPDLENYGWEPYFNSKALYQTAWWPQPHYSAYLYAPFLWAYHHTGFNMFLNHTQRAIVDTMFYYPFQWIWTETFTEEQARMLLPLAWLVRVNDTDLYRGYLKTIATDMLASLQPNGALQEKLGPNGLCIVCPSWNNTAYGLYEAPLIETNHDTCVDLLYTTNFALVGLHEAYYATMDPFYLDAATQMIEFVVRIQVSSTINSYLDGAWLRAFDFKLWDYWGSAGDIGWGPWVAENGWTNSWIASVLGLRALNTSIWDITESSTVNADLLQKLCPQFFTGDYEYLCYQ